MTSGPSSKAETPARRLDLLHLYDRILGCCLGAYFVGVGVVSIWRGLAGQDAFNLRQLLVGLFLTAALGPAVILWFIFFSQSRARTIPIGRGKRIIGSLAGLFVTVAGLCAMWMSIFHANAVAGAASGPDWDSFLGASTLVVAGLYGVYCCAVRGVDVE
jgi:hypothetical protein